MEDIRKRLEVCYTGVVHDVMRGRGLRNFTFPQELRPLIDDQVLCGPAFTIEGHVDDTADPHQTLVEWTGLMAVAAALVVLTLYGRPRALPKLAAGGGLLAAAAALLHLIG